MSTRFLLIRHAAVDTGNPPRLCGTYDVPLSSKGRAQLLALHHTALADHAPDALYTSPLQRATDTARACAALWHLEPRIEPAFQEIHCGAFEGMPIEEIKRLHAAVWARNTAQNDDAFRWPRGESYAQFRGRILGGLGRLALEHPGRTVAVVTHSGVIAQVLGTLRGRPAAVWELDRPDPLSATEVLWKATEPIALVGFNRREGSRALPQPHG
ncbi:MAG TPA: histidine phosphatase family protein [Vicinamibacterales bacterium]|nr:histidine phosphatase family protein [Vicinamibacterales bacterium]